MGDQAFADEAEAGQGGAGGVGRDEADGSGFLGPGDVEDLDAGLGREIGGVAEEDGGGGGGAGGSDAGGEGRGGRVLEVEDGKPSAGEAVGGEVEVAFVDDGRPQGRGGEGDFIGDDAGGERERNGQEQRKEGAWFHVGRKVIGRG